MLVVGLTGGVASGKSTVAALFGELGTPIVDADVVAREVVRPGSEGLAAVIEAFGKEVLTGTGELDRRGLRRLIFSDATLRKRLEAILHPRIREAMRAAATALSRHPYIIFVIPLLYETGHRGLIDRVLVIDCPEALQIERLVQRDRVSEDEARGILAAQATRSQRLTIADDIIVNGGNAERLKEAVARLHRGYLNHSDRCQN
ncbi:MAG: dephospho-CoA kinase [Gammaproteobacteria bacterium]|nr:dephospho-CoA kinase [Gammaproteobacteria bacterium]MBU1654041.1 dephospho-CoA kinase [Gammaproteobacteria bacterium]MBU1961749.1 dephospho-CoA kinase [Gammaproteobacteria bacterium]